MNIFHICIFIAYFVSKLQTLQLRTYSKIPQHKTHSLQHTTTHCHSLQPQYTAATLQHTTATLQHNATRMRFDDVIVADTQH